MSTNIGQIKNSQILVEPSQKLREFIQSIKIIDGDIPVGIENIIYKNKPKDVVLGKQTRPEYLVSDKDKVFIKSLNLEKLAPSESVSEVKSTPSIRPLTLQDLLWLYNYLQKHNEENPKVYLHELLEGSEITLPQNEQVPRNKELEKRCQKLKAEQQNVEYHNMTKNVDGFRKRLPEDTIGYQLKMMNTHLIAVFQFIVSVITGFVFGFIGLELILGNLDFGFRLILGLICALVVAIAELYFLAKRLNQDLEFEDTANKVKQEGGDSGEKKVK